MTVDILIPTIGRADRLAAVAANIHDATEAEHRVVFIVEEHDGASFDAACSTGDTVLANPGPHNYAGACNHAYANTDGRYLFAGSDDLRFHRGWDRHALAVMGALERIEVVGTNDLLNPYVAAGTHATHYLVDRRYLDRDGGVVDRGPGSFMCDLLQHQYTDTEFVGTAKARVRFMPCMEAIVEHMHFLAGKSPHDETYVRAYADIEEDSALYDSRRPLWQDLSR